LLEAFIKRYGDSFYAEIARARLEELKRVATVAAPIAPSVAAVPCVVAPVAVSLSSRGARPLSAAEECVLKPKDVFKECDKCPEMVVVPAGTFTMGSPDSEQGRDIDESPQHSVTFAKPFS